MEPEEHFLSKVKGIRSKNLRRFLKVYFYSYVHERRSGNPLISTPAMEYPRRHARVFPGLQLIQRYLRCSKGAAQDYLRAVYITHEILVRYEQSSAKHDGKEYLALIDRKKHEELLRDLAGYFESSIKPLRKQAEKEAELRLGMSELRNALRGASDLIAELPGALAVDECARIIDELASWFV